MAEPAGLIIVGASARAAAFSALRAGLEPWCADLFADADLQARCLIRQLPAVAYPDGFRALLSDSPPGPWIYTGGLENHPKLVRSLTRLRPLWGNDAPVLALVRDPLCVRDLFQRSGVPRPDARTELDQAARARRWLIKPLRSAGGRGIAIWQGETVRNEPIVYQQFIDGEPCAAVYNGRDGRAQLLGVTRQLVGEQRLRAAPFHYCGSIGPLALAPAVWQAFERIGNVLAGACPLRGLFGVDCMLADGVPYPVEVNPRYTASVEVLEHATGTAALALHRGVFDPNAPNDLPARSASEGREPAQIIGKAILFSRAALTFPADGPWLDALRRPADPWQLPAFADIPHAGERIEARRPILTCFARADSVVACRDRLWRMAEEVERALAHTC